MGGGGGGGVLQNWQNRTLGKTPSFQENKVLSKPKELGF